jgi:hypothetical protein
MDKPVLRIWDVYPGSRTRIFVHPRSRIADLGSWIPEPKAARTERGEKFSCHTFFCSQKNQKLKIYFNFEQVKKKIWANLQRIIELSTQKIVIKLSKV